MTTSSFNAEEHEIAVLGAILTGGTSAATEAIATLPLEEVSHPLVLESLEVVQGMIDRGVRVDLTTIGREWKLQHGNRPAPIDLWRQAPEFCPSESNLSLHVSEVRQAAFRRKTRDAANLLSAHLADPSKVPAELISDFEKSVTVDPMGGVTEMAKSYCHAFVTDMEERFKSKGKLSGIETGFHVLDEMTDGFQPEEMTVIGARPSIGKSAIAVSIAHRCCLELGVPTLFVTCEMSPKALMRRFVSSVSGVPIKVMKKGTANDQQFKAMTNANAMISRSKLMFSNCIESPRIGAITSRIWRAVRSNGVKLVIVDYLQKIKPGEKQEKRTYEVAEVSGKLKSLAVNSGVSMLVLAQLNRESENDKERLPRMTDLADSGQIERDADTVGLLHRSRFKEPEKAVLIVAKQRDGETGPVPLHFQGTTCRFTNRSHDDDEQPTKPSYDHDE